MSSHESDVNVPEPSGNKLLTSAAGWIGVVLIIASIFGLAYIYSGRDQTGLDAEVAANRLKTREEVNAKETALVTEYDKSGDTIRIPVNVAMEQVIGQLNAKPVKAMAAATTQPAQPAAPATQPAAPANP